MAFSQHDDHGSSTTPALTPDGAWVERFCGTRSLASCAYRCRARKRPFVVQQDGQHIVSVLLGPKKHSVASPSNRTAERRVSSRSLPRCNLAVGQPGNQPVNSSIAAMALHCCGVHGTYACRTGHHHHRFLHRQIHHAGSWIIAPQLEPVVSSCVGRCHSAVDTSSRRYAFMRCKSGST